MFPYLSKVVARASEVCSTVHFDHLHAFLSLCMYSHIRFTFVLTTGFAEARAAAALVGCGRSRRRPDHSGCAAANSKRTAQVRNDPNSRANAATDPHGRPRHAPVRYPSWHAFRHTSRHSNGYSSGYSIRDSVERGCSRNTAA